MSRTKRGSKDPNYEYWSKRGDNPNGILGYGKYAKHITKRRERQQDKKLVINETTEALEESEK